MNNIFMTPRGFPLDEVTFQRLQQQYDEPVEALASIFGGDRILQGLLPGNTPGELEIGDGYIVFRGEILPFRGGDISNFFSIIEEIINLPFNVGTNDSPIIEDHPGYKIRYAQIGEVDGAQLVQPFGLLKRAKLLEYSIKGQTYLGNIITDVREGTSFEIAFPNIGTNSYQVISSFYSLTSSPANDFGFEITDRTSTSFRLVLRNVPQGQQNILYQYTVVPNLQTGGPIL